MHDVAHGVDAPYGQRDARFWWGVVAVFVVVITVSAVGALVGR